MSGKDKPCPTACEPTIGKNTGVPRRKARKFEVRAARRTRLGRQHGASIKARKVDIRSTTFARSASAGAIRKRSGSFAMVRATIDARKQPVGGDRQIFGQEMSGLLALLDDVAALMKLAAATIDDAAGQAATASSKAAGVVIDDAAVTPRFVAGLAAHRELPIVGRIAVGSLKNKLLILLPLALVLSYLWPQAITPLLMLGGLYLCLEGQEKLQHVLSGKEHVAVHALAETPLDAVALEEAKVTGAIRTDFVLSAEIMAIALASIEAPDLLTREIGRAHV